MCSWFKRISISEKISNEVYDSLNYILNEASIVSSRIEIRSVVTISSKKWDGVQCPMGQNLLLEGVSGHGHHQNSGRD